MPIDMSKYLGLFTSEASEHLENLSRDLVRLEKEKGPELIDSMFRHAHSVKGMAASMGFDQIATLAHRVEDLVGEFRKDPKVISADNTDVILAASDLLLAMVKAAGAGEAGPDASALITRLSEQLKRMTGAPPAETRVLPATVNVAVPATVPEAPASKPAPAAGEVNPETGLPPRLAVKVRIAASCPVPGVRGFLVHKKLSALGNVFELHPALDDLKAGRIPDGVLTLELETSAGLEGVRKSLKTVADLDLVEVQAIESKVAPPPAPVRPAVAAEEKPPDAPKPIGAETARTVRVKTELLDYFLDAVGELLLATARLREIGKTVSESSRAPLEEGVDRLHAIVKDLHGKVMSVRMTPLSIITDRLPRAARDIARKKNREVDLVITGAEIELDRAILDELADPLLHILRNCIDHGLEDPADRSALGKGPRGRVVVAARRDRDRVLVEIEDDGRGMNGEKLKLKAVEAGLITADAARLMTDREAFMLACLPGISTATDITDISGRGVGMDAVKRAVENVGGTLEIDSTPGRGTRFTLRLPLTVAVLNVLLVESGSEVFGLPIAKVQAVVEADPASLSRSRNAPLLPHAGELLPVHVLDELLALKRTPGDGARPHVVVDADGGKVALEVDRLLGQQEAVLKPLSRPLDLVSGLAGVTILGSGRPIFILDVPRLIAA